MATEIATTDLELIAYHSIAFNFSRSQSLVIVRSYVERNSFLLSPLPQTQPNPYSHSNFANVSFAVPGEGERGLSGLTHKKVKNKFRF